LFGDGDDAVADDLDQNGADAGVAHGAVTWMTRLPSGSTSIRSPGISTVVEACSSISAGPAIVLPAKSVSRSKTGVDMNCPAKQAGRVPREAWGGGVSTPVAMRSNSGLASTPVTAVRKDAISAGSFGTDVP